jgi:hypothetical protein
MNNNRIPMTVGLLIILFIMPICGAAADKQKFCNSYADIAVKQYNNAIQNNLPGIAPPAWSNDRNGHFNWCMAVPENFANGETTKRQVYLDKNIAHDATNKKTATGTIAGTAGLMHDNMDALIAAAAAISDKSFLGCFKDSNKRDLSGYAFSSPKMTKNLCVDTCRRKGFKYAGLQYSQQCFCGNSYGKLGKSDNCNMPCSGNKGEICGGGWANSVYQISAGTKTAGTAPGVIGTIAGADLSGHSSLTTRQLLNRFQLTQNQPVNSQLLETFMTRRASVKEKDKIYLSPMESPVFDIAVHGKSVPVKIGSGYNSLLKTAQLPALEPISRITTMWPMKSYSDSGYSKTLDQYYKHMGIDITVSGSYLFVSGSTETKFEKNEQQNKFLETFSLINEIETFLQFPSGADLQLTQEAKRVLSQEGIDQFYQKYGDCFIYAIQYGAGIRASGSYKKYKSTKQVKFSNTTNIGAQALVWSADVQLQYDSNIKEKKEKENINFVVDSYGVITPSNYQSIDKMRNKTENLLRDAYEFAKQTNNTNKYGSVVYYTVVKYSSLPEFQTLAGGPDKLNLIQARAMLDKLLYYRRKLQRMLNNLHYIVNNPDNFKEDAVIKATANSKIVAQFLYDLNNDIGRTQRDPFNRQLLASINLDKFRSIPDYAPSSQLVHAVVEFPAVYTSDAETRNIGKPHTYWDDHYGPLLGYEISRGDGDVYSNCCIDVNINSKLIVTADKKDVYLIQGYMEHENKGDHTTIKGSKRLRVYSAPPGYIVKGFPVAKADFYLRNLKGENRMGGPVIDVLKLKDPTVKNGLWKDLKIIIDNQDWDQDWVGLFGTMDFAVEIEGIIPREYE